MDPHARVGAQIVDRVPGEVQAQGAVLPFGTPERARVVGCCEARKIDRRATRQKIGTDRVEMPVCIDIRCRSRASLEIETDGSERGRIDAVLVDERGFQV